MRSQSTLFRWLRVVIIGSTLLGLLWTSQPLQAQSLVCGPDISVKKRVTTGAITPDSQAVLIAGAAGDTAVMSLDGKQFLRRYRFNGGTPDGEDFAVSPDGTQIAAKELQTTNNNGPLNVWDVATNHVIYSFRSPDPGGSLYGQVFSPDGKILYTGGNHARAWDLTTGKLLQNFADPT